jgi:hypothetical protein
LRTATRFAGRGCLSLFLERNRRALGTERPTSPRLRRTRQRLLSRFRPAERRSRLVRPKPDSPRLRRQSRRNRLPPNSGRGCPMAERKAAAGRRFRARQPCPGLLLIRPYPPLHGSALPAPPSALRVEPVDQRRGAAGWRRCGAPRRGRWRVLFTQRPPERLTAADSNSVHCDGNFVPIPRMGFRGAGSVRTSRGGPIQTHRCK